MCRQFSSHANPEHLNLSLLIAQRVQYGSVYHHLYVGFPGQRSQHSLSGNPGVRVSRGGIGAYKITDFALRRKPPV